MQSYHFRFISRLKKASQLSMLLMKVNTSIIKRTRYNQAFAINTLHSNNIRLLEKQVVSSHSLLDSHSSINLFSYIKYPLVTYLLGAIIVSFDFVNSYFPSKVLNKIGYVHPIVLVYFFALIHCVYQTFCFKEEKRSKRLAKDQAIVQLNSAQIRKKISLKSEYQMIVNKSESNEELSDHCDNYENLLTTRDSIIPDIKEIKEKSDNSDKEENVILIYHNENTDENIEETTENYYNLHEDNIEENKMSSKEKRKKKKKNKIH